MIGMISILNSLNFIIPLWSCKRSILVLENTHQSNKGEVIIKDKVYTTWFRNKSEHLCIDPWSKGKLWKPYVF